MSEQLNNITVLDPILKKAFTNTHTNENVKQEITEKGIKSTLDAYIAISSQSKDEGLLSSIFQLDSDVKKCQTAAKQAVKEKAIPEVYEPLYGAGCFAVAKSENISNRLADYAKDREEIIENKFDININHLKFK